MNSATRSRNNTEASAPENIPNIPCPNDISQATVNFLEELIKRSNEAILQKLDASVKHVAHLTAKLDEAQDVIKTLREEIDTIKVDADDLQQYGRRLNVRIEGIEYVRGESEDELYEKVKENLSEVDVKIKKRDVIRFHRSAAPKRNNYDGRLCAQVIVKFARWEHRRAAHFANKKACEGRKSFRVHHDLTKRRYNLLSQAREALKAKYPPVNRPDDDQGVVASDDNRPPFAYADMNSNLVIRQGKETFRFNTKAELDCIIDQL